MTILNIFQNKNIPLYGDGKNIRDWIYIVDHVEALLRVCSSSNTGEKYCIGSNFEISNIELVYKICKIMDKLNPTTISHKELIKFVDDRPGHDYRYGIDPSKIRKN